MGYHRPMARKKAQLGEEEPVGIPERRPPKGKRGCEACAIVGPKATVQLCMRRTGRPPGQYLANANDVCTLMHGLENADRESFYMLHVNVRHKIVDIDKVAVGTQSGVEVHPREVFRGAMLSGAHAVIAVHNHPSGESDPSRQDVELTHRLRSVGELVGIPVLDHIIVSSSGCKSLAATGQLGEPKQYEILANQPPRRRRG